MTPYQVATLACRLALIDAVADSASGVAQLREAAFYIPQAMTLLAASAAEVEAETNHEVQEAV